MTSAIVMTAADYEALWGHLLRNPNQEEAAILLAGVARTARQVSLLVREIHPVPYTDFLARGNLYLSIDPDFLAPLVKRCRAEGWGFILTHSHPFSESHVSFSGIDDAGEAELFPRIRGRAPGFPHAAMVFGQSSLAARVWLPGPGGPEPVDLVKVIGDRILRIPSSNAGPGMDADLGETHHRQVLAFGEVGQSLIQGTRVGVVGIGGVGSQVYQMLAHLGVREILPVDDENLELANLSRVVGIAPEDVGTPKAHLAHRLGTRINPALKGKPIVGSVEHLSVARRLLDLDVIFCCTDNLTSRVVVNRIAHQYLIPVIDMGIDIQPLDGHPGEIRAIGGRVMIIFPDGPCLGCLGVLDPNLLAREASGAGRGRSYVEGQEVPAPSVISLNGTVASLAVTGFLNLVTGFARRTQRIYQRYDAVKGFVRTYALVPEQPCQLCREVKALGDAEPLPCHLDR